jgi:hypothetical protein
MAQMIGQIYDLVMQAAALHGNTSPFLFYLQLISDVPARAWPECPGFGLALGGLGLRKL